MVLEVGGRTVWRLADGRSFVVTEGNKEALLLLLDGAEPELEVKVAVVGERRKQLIAEANLD